MQRNDNKAQLELESIWGGPKTAAALIWTLHLNYLLIIILLIIYYLNAAFDKII